jgi:protein-S-isoprenylcysteine O-methyltransferase Ste14
MEWILFATAVFLELIYILLFILTVKLPRFRFWPPPSSRSWQFILAWLMVGVVGMCGIWLGLLDLDSAFLFDFRIRLPLAGIFFVFGNAIGGWGNLALGMRGTLGLGNRLIVKGAYQYTRNPQYLGDSLIIFGFMLLTNSWMVWIIGILALALNILAPYTEEPWLEEQYGDSYLEYKRRVPRFVGRCKVVSPHTEGDRRRG